MLHDFLSSYWGLGLIVFVGVLAIQEAGKANARRIVREELKKYDAKADS